MHANPTNTRVEVLLENKNTVVADGRFEIVRGVAERSDALVETDPATLAALLYGGGGLEEALGSGDVRIEGEGSAVERFLTLFPLPDLTAGTVP